MKWKAK